MFMLNWIPFSHQLKPTKTHPETLFTDTMPFSQSKGSNGISKQMPLKINHKKHENQNLTGSASTETILTQPFK